VNHKSDTPKKNTMNILKSLHAFFLAMTLLLTSPMAFSNIEVDALKLFAWLESKYPDVLGTPEFTSSVLRTQGYTYRHYPETDISLALFGDQFYAVGGLLGKDVISLGTIENFVAKSVTDISNIEFTLRAATCSYFVAKNIAVTRDLSTDSYLAAKLDVRVAADGTCKLLSNSLPNHDTGSFGIDFVSPVLAVPAEVKISSRPKLADMASPSSFTRTDAILLNGVKLESLGPNCFSSTDEKALCADANQPWRYDPRSGGANVILDAYFGHTEETGLYHYHGGPAALFEQFPNIDSPVIGFAADGFPIYGSYFTDKSGTLRTANSSYVLKPGSRPSGIREPGGSYDGTFVDDYEYIAGSGDLDECNGMTVEGQYGYYVTNAYPWVLGCLKGTPDDSFSKALEPVSLPQTLMSNYTSYDTRELLTAAALISEHARDRKRNIKVFVWPVGSASREATLEDRQYMAFTPHFVTMTNTEIESLLTEMLDWIDISCPNMNSSSRTQESIRLRYLLENGGDAATLGVPCYSAGMGLVAATSETNFDTLKYIIAHETYHGIQQDLEIEACRDRREANEPNNSRWLAEGTADYVAKSVLAGMDGGLSLEQRILKDAYLDYQAGETQMSTRQGSAALLLMVKRGELDERIILDGSMFWKCETLDVYNDTNPIISNAKTSWFMIDEDTSTSPVTYKFSGAAFMR
jgi:hypothetical protein